MKLPRAFYDLPMAHRGLHDVTHQRPGLLHDDPPVLDALREPQLPGVGLTSQPEVAEVNRESERRQDDGETKQRQATQHPTHHGPTHAPGPPPSPRRKTHKQ